MADPHIQPVLDGFDRGTVRAYRVGLVVSALGLAWVAASMARGAPAQAAWWATWLGVVLSVGHLHLYDKRIRWLVQWLAWSALLLRAGGGLWPPAAVPVVASLATGLLLAALSVVVVKEWFCFRIPLVRWTPLVLATGVIGRFLQADTLAMVCFGLGALAVASVAVAKWRMPLGHDVGDRSAYQI